MDNIKAFAHLISKCHTFKILYYLNYIEPEYKEIKLSFYSDKEEFLPLEDEIKKALIEKLNSKRSKKIEKEDNYDLYKISKITRL